MPQLTDDNAYRRYLRTAEERYSYREAVGGYVLVPNGYGVVRFGSISRGDQYIQGYSGRSWEDVGGPEFNAKRFIIKKGTWRQWIPCSAKSK